ncbi:TolC family protein [Muribaculaceae bacterium Isolate-110 (HZI)]|nr:TolC family protein [Muribaculaceae bacterium Isolate-110 (HZI)]
MNNYRLLRGLLCATLLSGGVCVMGQSQTTISLEEIFEIAEAQSVQLRVSKSAETEAEKDVSVAHNGRLPDINASLSLSFIGDGFTTKRNFSDYQKAPIPHLGTGLSVNITQPVYTGGAVTAAIDMSRLKSTASRFATELQRDNLRFNIAGLYLDIYRFATLRDVVSNNILQAEKMLAEMKARYEQGVALQNGITRYELLLSNLELQMVKINNTLAILNNNLVVTAGLSENTVVKPDTTILARSLPVSGEAIWQQEAVASSPTLRLARTDVDITRKAESLVKVEKLPKVGVQVGWTMDGPILVEVPPINRNLSYWYVGVGVSYNISSLFKTNKAMDKSRAATVTAEDCLAAAREGVELAVRADYIKYMEAYEELKTQNKSVELAERNYRTTSTRYSADMALITDLLDAANAKLDAEQKLVNARIDIIYYYYKLLFTTGKI